MSSNLSRLERLPENPEPMFLRVELLVDQTGIDRQSKEWGKFEEVLAPLITELPETWRHSKRVTAYALGVAAMENWPDNRLLAQGGLTHDIGKLALSPEIDRDDSLSGTEKEVARSHAKAGFERLWKAGLPFTAFVAGRHHLYQEDPYGVDFARADWLNEDDRAYIDHTTRLVALADHFDTMNTRGYKAAIANDPAAQRASLAAEFPTAQDQTRIDWLLANKIR
jgi:putative nucleotidyltransferase with HDIG domain